MEDRWISRLAYISWAKYESGSYEYRDRFVKAWHKAEASSPCLIAVKSYQSDPLQLCDEKLRVNGSASKSRCSSIMTIFTGNGLFGSSRDANLNYGAAIACVFIDTEWRIVSGTALWSSQDAGQAQTARSKWRRWHKGLARSRCKLYDEGSEIW